MKLNLPVILYSTLLVFFYSNFHHTTLYVALCAPVHIIAILHEKIVNDIAEEQANYVLFAIARCYVDDTQPRPSHTPRARWQPDVRTSLLRTFNTLKNLS